MEKSEVIAFIVSVLIGVVSIVTSIAYYIIKKDEAILLLFAQ